MVQRPVVRLVARLLVLIFAAALVGCSSSGGGASTGSPSTARSAPSEATTTAATESAAPTTASTSPTSSAPTPIDPPGTYAVGSYEETLVDKSRGTVAHDGQPAMAERPLPVVALYPAQGAPGDSTDKGAKPEKGPWPLVLVGHGNRGTGPAYVATMRVWASAGYVVIAPTFPLSNTNTPGNTVVSDVPEQARDESFVIDWAINASKSSTRPPAGLVDPEAIGVAGHSLGGFTALTEGYNPCCRDDRIDAVAEWAGGYALAGNAAPEAGPPLLIVHGDADDTVDYQVGQNVWAKTAAPKYFVTLVGGGHIPPYVQGLTEPTSAVVTTVTLDFFDRYLKNDPTGIDRLSSTVKEAGPERATVRVDEQR